MQSPTYDSSWHHDAAFYQLHVTAFHDADGDGFGDFRGLIEKRWSGQPFPTISEAPYLLPLSGRDFFWFRIMPEGAPARLDAVAEVGA